MLVITSIFYNCGIYLKMKASLSQNHLDKLLVVDVALGVLLAVYQLLHLLLAHLLPEPGQEVAQLHRGDQTVTLLVEMLEALNKVIHCVSDGFAGHVLQHWQEHFECNAGILLLSSRANVTSKHSEDLITRAGNKT